MRLVITGCIGLDTSSSTNVELNINDYIWSEVFRRLDYANSVRPISTIAITDGTSPVLSAVSAWAENNGISVQIYVATYRGNDKSSGAQRNSRLLKNFKPDQVVAFTWLTLEKDIAASLLLEQAGKQSIETHHIDLFKSTKEF